MGGRKKMVVEVGRKKEKEQTTKEKKEISFPSPGWAYLFCWCARVVIREWIRHWSSAVR